MKNKLFGNAFVVSCLAVGSYFLGVAAGSEKNDELMTYAQHQQIAIDRCASEEEPHGYAVLLYMNGEPAGNFCTDLQYNKK